MICRFISSRFIWLTVKALKICKKRKGTDRLEISRYYTLVDELEVFVHKREFNHYLFIAVIFLITAVIYSNLLSYNLNSGLCILVLKL